ncbi:oxidoreductase [Mycobacterium tuberculosis]|nr:oxidoreductase [Mycobacterium tuberculosis]
MHITGGSVSVHRPTHHHRARGRLTLQNYTATTARILRQLAADHRSVAMILLVPILIIRLMYFMFENVPHRPGTPSGFNTACLVLLGLFPLFVMFVITAITMQRERASGTLERILTTTRSVRKRLDFDKPVPRDVLMECLELALQAPTGSNSQGWQWVFVEDAAKKKAIADVYLANARGYLSGPAPEYPDGDTRGERMGRVRDSATYLAEHMHRAPVLLIPCLKGREDESAVGGVSFWASLFPAVWSFCLALRSRGLGSCWTTLHLLDNGEHKVADVLGIPYDEYSQGGLLPIAYTQGIDFRPAKRLPAESVTHWNGW